MGPFRKSLEVSLEAAIQLDQLDEDKHAAIIEAARSLADILDLGNPNASAYSTYLNYCKALGVVPTQQGQQGAVVGAGNVAKFRANSRARLRAV